MNSMRPYTAPLDPKNRVAVLGLHGEGKLHLQFLRAPHEVENFFRLLRQAFEFSGQTSQRLIQREKLIAIFFQEFAPRLKHKAQWPGGSREKKN